MNPYQERVIEEKEALEEKYRKLTTFFDQPAFQDVPMDEQVRMARQADVMKEYLDILNARIVRFEP